MALVLRKAMLPKNISLLKWIKSRPLATAGKRTDATALLSNVSATLERVQIQNYMMAQPVDSDFEDEKMVEIDQFPPDFLMASTEISPSFMASSEFSPTSLIASSQFCGYYGYPCRPCGYGAYGPSGPWGPVGMCGYSNGWGCYNTWGCNPYVCRGCGCFPCSCLFCPSMDTCGYPSLGCHPYNSASYLAYANSVSMNANHSLIVPGVPASTVSVVPSITHWELPFAPSNTDANTPQVIKSPPEPTQAKQQCVATPGHQGKDVCTCAFCNPEPKPKPRRIRSRPYRIEMSASEDDPGVLLNERKGMEANKLPLRVLNPRIIADRILGEPKDPKKPPMQGRFKPSNPTNGVAYYSTVDSARRQKCKSAKHIDQKTVDPVKI